MEKDITMQVEKDGKTFEVESVKTDVMPERHLTISQFAAATGISKTKLRMMDKAGTLTPAGRTEGGHRYYTMEQALAYAASLPPMTRRSDPGIVTLGQLVALIPAGVKMIIGECRNKALKSSRIWCFDGTDDEATMDYVETNSDCEVLQVALKLEHQALQIKIRKAV
jgi:hypothetical protein